MPVDSDTFDEGGERYSIENEILEFLYDNREQAFNLGEITVAVMEPGWSEADADPDEELDASLGCLLDMATVSSILDGLVDNGALERRVLDAGDGLRSYYRAR